ncbi:MAG: hypothetical protein H7832_05545 [Magnetococcus sp. DMHC-6]
MAQQQNILHRKTDGGSMFMSAMSYLGILALVPLILDRGDSYLRFHARQGMILWIWEVLAVFTLVLPGIGKPFFMISSFMCFLLSVLGLISVLLGRAWRLPIVGYFSDKL